MIDEAGARKELEGGRILDALAGIVWTSRADGLADFFNRRWLKYTGLGLDEALGHGWQAAIHPQDLGPFLKSWEAVRQSGGDGEIEGRLRRFDGEYRWFVFRCSPLADGADQGQRWCWLALHADETPAGPDGPTPDGRLRRFVDMLPTQVTFLDPSGEAEFCNRQVLDYYGMPFEQLQQWTTSGAIHTDDLPDVYDSLSRLLSKGEIYDAQHRMRHVDGTYRWVHARAVPSHDAQGNIVRYVSCQTDVHDLKRAEALLGGEVRILEMVALGRPLPELMDALCRLTEALVADCYCSILLVDPDHEHFRVGGGPSLPDSYNRILDGKTIDPDYGPCSLSVVIKAPVITSDLQADPRWTSSIWPPLMAEHGLRSCWSMPIMSGAGEVIGIFAVYRREPVGPTAAEQELIDRFAKIAGIAIERARTDDALQASDAELRQALGHLNQAQRLSHTGSFTTFVDTDEHIWSDELYRILEFELGVGVKFQDFRALIHKDDLRAFDVGFRKSMRDGVNFDQTFRINTPKGTNKYLHAVSHFVERNVGGNIAVGSIQDVTESKNAEAALRASGGELRRTLAQLAEGQRLNKTGSFTADLQLDEPSWSDEYFRIFEIDPATPPSVQASRDRVHPDDLELFDREIQRGMEDGAADFTFRILAPQAGLKYVRAVAHVVEHVDGRPIFTGTVQDVTASTLAEKALERARSELAYMARATALSALTASIAHEVNQPLAGIITNASTCLRMLATDPPNAEGARATAQRTIRDANRASEVIKRLRALFARKPAENEPLDLNEAAQEILILSTRELQTARAVVETDFAKDLPPVVGDRVQLQQVILNLVLNAAQAMQTVDDWPRELRISTAPDDAGGVLLSVRDSGIGVAPAVLEQLFNAFYTTKPDGMGVGLSVSRSIIEAHGGRLSAKANDGPGLTFSFSIPVTPLANLAP
jgi:PAS domain S-box-containing protein